MKQCRLCKEIKEDSNFYTRSDTNKLYGTCKSCQIVEHRTNRKNNPKKYKETAHKNNMAAKHRVTKRYSVYKNRALNKRKVIFKLSIEEFEKITSLKCNYCNGFSTNVDYVGIDRIDSGKGYTIDNCISCCDKCNFMKKDYPVKEFIQHILKIASFYVKEEVNDVPAFVENLIEDTQARLRNGVKNLTNVVDFLKTSSYIDEEDIRYFPEKYPFSNKDFKDVFCFLEAQARENYHDVTDITDKFPEYRAYFKFAGVKFIWNLMIGQGSALTLFRHDHKPDLIPYREDLEIKL